MKNLKKTFTIIFITLTSFCFSQTAAYYCSQTGAVGFCYGYGNVKECAYNQAYRYGATNPQLILNYNGKGYGALAVGTNSYGIRVVGIAAGYDSLSRASNVAFRECRKRGGTGIYISDTWLDQ